MKTKAMPPDYDAEHALHILTEAEKHKRDPHMMARVSKLAAEKKEHLGRVARMKPKMTKSAPKRK